MATVEAGIEVKLQAMELISLLAQQRQGNFEAALGGWSGRVDPDGNLHHLWTCAAPTNDSKYCVKEMDEALDGARASTDPAARKTLYDKAAEILIRDRPIVYLYHNPWIFALSSKLDGFVPYPERLDAEKVRRREGKFMDFYSQAAMFYRGQSEAEKEQLNEDLREEKGWSYGVYSNVSQPVGPRTLVVKAPVQSDRTADAIEAIIADMAAFPGKKPVTAEELQRVTEGAIRSLPNDFETNAAVQAGIRKNDLLDRPDDYYATLAGKFRSIGA